MKKLICLLLTAVMILSCGTGVVSATSSTLLYDEVMLRPNEAPRQWTITPNVTGEYVLFAPDCFAAEVLGQTGSRDPAMTGGVVYSLTANTAYTVQASLKSECFGEYPNGYMDLVRLEKKEPLQRIYFYEDKISCQQYDSVGFQVFAEPSYYKVENLVWAISDSSMGQIMDTYDINASVRMKKQGKATVTATMMGKTASCEVTVQPMTGEWDSYPLWPANQTRKKLTWNGGIGNFMRYIPDSDGWYVFYDEEGKLTGDIRHASSAVNVARKMAFVDNKNMDLYQLYAGETYIIGYGPNGTDATAATGTLVLEKAKKAERVELYGPNMVSGSTIVGYVGGIQDLGANTVPGYSYVLEGNGFAFTSSNPSVAVVESTGNVGDSMNLIRLVGPGSCNVIVRAGGKEAVCKVTVLDPPKLEVGKTVTLQHSGHTTGVTVRFTPPASGNYSVKITGAGGTCAVKDTDISTYFYNGTGYLSGWFTAGRTYEVDLFIDGSRHTVAVSGGASGGEQEEPAGPVATNPGATEIQPTDGVTPDRTEPATTPTTEEKPAAQVGVQVENGTVAPDEGQLVQALEAVQPGEIVQINAAEQKATAVSLSKQVLTQVVAAGVQLQVQLKNAAVTLDGAALTAIDTQAGQSVELHCDIVAADALSATQQAALKGFAVDGIVQLKLESNGQIHDFGGGKAAVQLRADMAAGVQVYYVAPDGRLEKLEAEQKDGNVTFTTGHFSDFALVREAENGGSVWPIVLVIVAVLAAGGAAAFIFIKKKKTA